MNRTRLCRALALTKTYKEQDKIFWRNRVNSSVFSILLSQQRQKTSNFFTTFECDRLNRKLSQSGSTLNASPISRWIGSWHRTVHTSVPNYLPYLCLQNCLLLSYWVQLCIKKYCPRYLYRLWVSITDCQMYALHCTLTRLILFCMKENLWNIHGNDI